VAAVVLSLAVKRLGQRSLTLVLRCEGPEGQLRVAARQVLVTTSLHTHAAVDIPADIRAAIARTSASQQ
jgi:4-hydroxybenzoyl-CoA thioesterase